MSSLQPWYTINNISLLDTPAVVVYLDRAKTNIETLIKSIDDVGRLRPHIKTHKSSEITQLMLDSGIRKFKCATIAEAEMLALAGAPDVLLAYQPVGPKAERLANLVQKYPDTKFSCLIDNRLSATNLSAIFSKKGIRLEVFVDLNVGMNRTGILPESAFSLFKECQPLEGIKVVGLHAYDGHIRDVDFNARKKRCDEAFVRIENLHLEIQAKENIKLLIVAGGSPSYSIHSKRKGVECSPGTFVYWDKGYEQILTEQHYLPAALVVTRIISKPNAHTICTDLGHKAVASENALSARVAFLNAPDLKPIGHSEEHMVFAAEDGDQYQVGDVLYGIPYHVCPTIALHDQPAIIVNHEIVGYWETVARNRKITV